MEIILLTKGDFNMFVETAVCPKGEKREGTPCEGYRKDGTLKNQCAYCERYKKYVKSKFPDLKEA